MNDGDIKFALHNGRPPDCLRFGFLLFSFQSPYCCQLSFVTAGMIVCVGVGATNTSVLERFHNNWTCSGRNWYSFEYLRKKGVLCAINNDKKRALKGATPPLEYYQEQEDDEHEKSKPLSRGNGGVGRVVAEGPELVARSDNEAREPETLVLRVY